MATFKDAAGREWQIKLDAPTIEEVRAEVEVDLADPTLKQFEQLGEDPVALVNTLWVICRPQAAQQVDGGVNARQFGEALVGDAIDEATEALLNAITDFTPRRQRSLMRRIATANQQVREKALQLAQDRIGDPELAERLEQALADQMEAALAKLMRRESVTNSPESAESAPTD